MAGRQLADLVRVDHPRVDAQQAVDLRALVHDERGAVGVRQGEVALLGEEQVEVQLRREALVELHRGLVEPSALGGAVVRAQDRRVAPRRAGADVVLLEDRDVRDPALAQVVGGGQAVRAAADDHDVVARLQLAAGAPHAPLAEDVTHRRPPALRRGARPRRPPRSTGSPRARSRRAAEAVGVLADHHRRHARDEPGRNAPGGMDSGRRSSALRRREGLAREGPRIASAAKPAVRSTTDAPAASRRSRSARVAAGSVCAARACGQRAPPAVVHPRRPARAQLGPASAPRSAGSAGARACPARSGRRSRRSCGRARPRPPGRRSPSRSASRRARRSARRRRGRGARAGCGPRGRPRRCGRGERNSSVTSAAPRPRGRRTAAW